jgi:hypothetical protein
LLKDVCLLPVHRLRMKWEGRRGARTRPLSVELSRDAAGTPSTQDETEAALSGGAAGRGA